MIVLLSLVCSPFQALAEASPTRVAARAQVEAARATSDGGTVGLEGTNRLAQVPVALGSSWQRQLPRAVDTAPYLALVLLSVLSAVYWYFRHAVSPGAPTRARRPGSAGAARTVAGPHPDVAPDCATAPPARSEQRRLAGGASQAGIEAAWEDALVPPGAKWAPPRPARPEQWQSAGGSIREQTPAGSGDPLGSPRHPLDLRATRPPSPSDGPEPLEAALTRCGGLLAAGRIDEAARIADGQLRQHPGDGRLLLLLSQAMELSGDPDQALLLAILAQRAHRSPASTRHLLHLMAVTESFEPSNGDWLRRAVARYPEKAGLLHASGVFEAMYGDRRAAGRLLRAALRCEPDEGRRREIATQLARLTAPRSTA